MISDLAPVALGTMALILGGVLKGVTGLGGPMIAVPLLASMYSIPVALSVMVVPNIISNLWLMWSTRDGREGRSAMWWMLVGCGVGVVLGTLLLGLLPESWLSIWLAILILIFVCIRVAQPTFQIGSERARRTALPVGFLTGILQGSTGISGPVGATFIIAQRLRRESQIFVLSAIFLVLALFQASSLAAIGLLTPVLFGLSTLALFPMALGVWLGQHLANRVGARFFDALIIVILVATASMLLLGS